MMQNAKLLSIIFLVAFCSACGFHLRGQVAMPDSLKFMRISPDAPFDPFHKALARNLQTNNIQLVNSPESKVAVLRIKSNQFSEQSMAVASDAVTSRIRITLSVEYEFIDSDQKTLLLSNSATSSREFSTSQQTVLQSDSERDTLKDELRLDVIMQMLRQLSSLAKTTTE